MVTPHLDGLVRFMHGDNGEIGDILEKQALGTKIVKSETIDWAVLSTC